MSIHKKRSLETSKNPIRNLPELIKAVQEHKKKLMNIKKEEFKSKKGKYIMKDKNGIYML